MKMELVNLNKTFRDAVAVRDVSLEVGHGELAAFLGPSGCGKTTTLLNIAGVYKPTSGDILFDGVRVNELQPKERDIGMVFQSYALYPHMSAYENIVFSLVLKKRPKDEMQREAKRVADMLGIGHLLDRSPSQLSGGQQQRVALARALIKRPKLLLFDEPLSNLDARLRMSMREEIKRLQVELGITSVYVTHDQVEAMSMADKVAVMQDGNLLAYVPPGELHEHPRTIFIAQFIGSPSMNILDAEFVMKEGKPTVILAGGKVELEVPQDRIPKLSGESRAVKFGIRPEHVFLEPQATSDAYAAVTFVESMGRENLVVCDVDGQRLQFLSAPGETVHLGDHVGMKIDMKRVQFFDPESGLSLLWT
ncbi:ABC transporter ATP-binding protein [Alkalispirochaeta alkalica]|uniref:ABC transporter ATP-binding protein n=1 Tax=Alkalispirochaeta alkalica TaxID=46356 RepID=UPI000369D989|nr:ABC transporter ATP-binding protein [Alkalispirochaeta alkalica]